MRVNYRLSLLTLPNLRYYSAIGAAGFPPPVRIPYNLSDVIIDAPYGWPGGVITGTLQVA